MNKEHTRPFCLEHARAGAPYACRSGSKAEVLKWDAKSSSRTLIGVVSTLDGEEMAYSWNANGSDSSLGESYHDLVMKPLGFVAEKPVFVGDEMEVLHGGLWNKFKVEVRGIPVIEIDEAKIPYKIRWPTPEPETELSDEELYSVYRQPYLDQAESLRAVANAAIRRYVAEQERAK